jgi:hypothetical protein
LKEVHTLDNGLKLEFIDTSRQIAADRWLVGLTLRIQIAVEPVLADAGNLSFNEIAAIKALLGPEISYEAKRERNFIESQEKQAVWQQLKDNAAANALKYYAHPEFARRYVMRTYIQRQKEASWKPA